MNYTVGTGNYVHVDSKTGRVFLNGAALAARIEKRDHIRLTYRPHMCWQAIPDNGDPTTCFDAKRDAAEYVRKHTGWQSVADLEDIVR